MSRPTPPVALTIAGTDSGAGAGVGADLKAFAAEGVHGVFAVTVVTAQSTTEVRAVHPMPVEMVQSQVDAVTDDFAVQATKTGLLWGADTVRAVAERALSRAGYQITACSDGEEGLAAFEQDDGFDLVVSDVVMPGMDGFQAARHIRDRDRHGRVRLIALTGVESPDTLERAARAGFDEFLKKPVSGRTLLGALGKGVTEPAAD